MADRRTHDLQREDVLRALAAKPGREPEGPQRSVLHGHEASAPTAADLPDRALVQQARSGVMHLPAWMFDGVEDRERLISALVFEARMAGLHRIDEVVPSASGTGVFAVQGQHGDLEHRSVYVDHARVAKEAVDAAELERQRDEERARQRAAERAAMGRPDEPAGPLSRLRNLLP